MGTISFDNWRSDELLHFPVTIVKQEAGVTIDKVCDPATINKGDDTLCTITIENTTFDDADVRVMDVVPRQLKLDKSSVVGGTTRGSRTVKFHGTIAGASPPIVDVAVDPLASPSGYLPLSLFGVAPIAGVGDETITNFGVPTFEYAGEL